MSEHGGAVGEVAREAVEALAEVTTSDDRRGRGQRRLNGAGFVILCLSLILTGWLCYGKIQDAREWKRETEHRLSRIEIKVDAVLFMLGANPAKIAAYTPAARPSPLPFSLDLLGESAYADTPAPTKKP